VYSSNALELFWLRSDDTNIASYQVTSGGDILGETDGVSFFIANLDSATTYTYSIQALDLNGVNVGTAAAVTLTTLD